MTSVVRISFEQAQELYGRFVYVLPFLAIPIYSIFALLGKGLTRRAFYFSLSTPGLFTLAIVLWEALTAEPRSYFLHPTSSILIGGLFLYPGYWILPVVWTIQVIRMIRGNWEEVRWSTLLGCIGILLLYVWEGVVVDAARS